MSIRCFGVTAILARGCHSVGWRTARGRIGRAPRGGGGGSRSPPGEGAGDPAPCLLRFGGVLFGGGCLDLALGLGALAHHPLEALKLSQDRLVFVKGAP